MVTRWNDIRRLAALIEAEADGREIDRGQAGRLAARLAERHPDISASLNLIYQRMASDRADAA